MFVRQGTPSHKQNPMTPMSWGFIYDWAGRIRTFEMTESESVALPLGDSPSFGIFAEHTILYTNPYPNASKNLIIQHPTPRDAKHPSVWGAE